jgi:hypothetical protein
VGTASAILMEFPERNRFRLKRLALWLLLEHDLSGKPASTFPDHALRLDQHFEGRVLAAQMTRSRRSTV